MDSRDLSSSSSTPANRDASAANDDGALSVTAALSKDAGLSFQSGKFTECIDVLKQLLQKKEDDPKVGYAHLDEEFDLDMINKISDIAGCDNKLKFISYMKKLFRKKKPKTKKVGKEKLCGNQAKYCPPIILEYIFRCGAVDCAIAFLEGETGFITDLNVPFGDGLYPLHLAANGLSYEMVKLLLCHGARTDVRTIEGSLRGDLFPLNVSLETLSYHQYLIGWTPKQSVFKLIIVLCLPQMKVPLEINRLIALRTKGVDKIFSHYAMEGELIEMATLLMVAREKIMHLSMFGSKDSPSLDGSMSIRENIIEEIVSLTEDEIKLIGSHKNDKLVEEIGGLTEYESKLLGRHKIGKLVRSLKDIKAAMTRGLLLLKVFEKAGAAVEKYRQSVQSGMPKEKVVNDVKALLERAGFVLKDEDVDLSDMDCESQSVKVATKALERTTFGSHSKYLYMPLDSLLGSFSKSSVSYRTVRSLSVATFLRYKYLVFMPSSRSYVSFPLMDKRKASYFPISGYHPSSSIPMRVSAGYLLSIDQFPSFALAIKKGLTRI